MSLIEGELAGLVIWFGIVPAADWWDKSTKMSDFT